ncbi:hypothetical protein CDCA_CDCA16G4126 [Cyanidium caldarium]|uniref:Uncharacterized protein n=1 Tax=Cyanidium caldarium TaxID=2771 RepID=A0AAV9J145_CYACA|nr:hypothetical protein CDCA_CDCA16G4126 [Cyanidium caldarium]
MISPWPALVSGATAAAVAVLVCTLIERLGGALGGVLGTVPGTITPASVGLWFAGESTLSFRQSVASAPIGLAINAGFLLCWRHLPPHLPLVSLWARLACMVCCSLALWAALAAPTMWILHWARRAGYHTAVYVAAAISAALVFMAGVAGTWRMPPAPKGARPVDWRTQLARGLLAFAAVSAAVLAAHAAPALAGILAVWPAVFLTTMVAMWISQGEAVQAGAVSPMILGMTAPMLFCGLACVTYPRWGAWRGCVVSWLAAVLSGTVPLALYVRWRVRCGGVNGDSGAGVLEVEGASAVPTVQIHDVGRDGAGSREDRVELYPAKVTSNDPMPLWSPEVDAIQAIA